MSRFEPEFSDMAHEGEKSRSGEDTLASAMDNDTNATVLPSIQPRKGGMPGLVRGALHIEMYVAKSRRTFLVLTTGRRTRVKEGQCFASVPGGGVSG